MNSGLPFVTETLASLWQSLKDLVPLLAGALLVMLVIFLTYKALTKTLYHALRRTVKRKEERKTIMAVWRYLFLFLTLLVLVFTFSGSLAATGISIGLMSAALGWALQKPITGIAAWIMILVKRPFKVGDRVIVDNIKGDISDITMFYIVLSEFGGTVGGEETSGRTILIPTSLLFDKPITNYTVGDAYILDEVGADFTYETELEKAEKIMVAAAKKFTPGYFEKTGLEPFTRVFFQPSGMHVKVRYKVLAAERQKVVSNITREVYSKVIKARETEFAYPHTELVWGKKPLKKQGRG